ncbi:MAG: hypothetical protein IJJ57_10005, partial [Ruminococcus sp.]|nr:hypothetical protein [Ruminococcus sp.]
DENKKKLYAIAKKYGRELEFMEMPDWSERLGINLRSSKKGWLGFGFNRLFVTEYVPEDVDRVLYLDSDTVIERPLRDMWYQDMTDYYLAGVDDCLSSKYRKIVGLGRSGIYVNSGMLLINVKKWIEDGVCRKLIDEIVKNNGFYIFNEQSLINSFFAGKVKILPQNYNVNTLVYLFEYNDLIKLRKPYNYSYSCEELIDAREKPYITHFTGNFYVRRRPWIKDSDHPHAKAFMKYRKISPWADAPLADDNRSLKLKFWTELCHILPRKLMLSLVSFLYNDLRVISFERKLKKERSGV